MKTIRKVIAEIVEDVQVRAETIPEPIAHKQYSGKFTAHLLPEIRRSLAVETAEFEVSLNLLARVRLSQ